MLKAAWDKLEKRMREEGHAPNDKTMCSLCNALAEMDDAVKATIVAADGILAPMTMEFGRIMEEAPSQLIEMTLGSVDAQVPASKFMALYRATDHG